MRPGSHAGSLPERHCMTPRRMTEAAPFTAEGSPRQKVRFHMTSDPQRRRPFRSRPSRRQLLTGALSGAGVLGAGFVTSSGTDILAEVGRNDHLRSVTVAFTSGTTREGVGAEAGLELQPDSRVMPGIEDPGPKQRQREFLDRCSSWLSPAARTTSRSCHLGAARSLGSHRLIACDSGQLGPTLALYLATGRGLRRCRAGPSRPDRSGMESSPPSAISAVIRWIVRRAFHSRFGGGPGRAPLPIRCAGSPSLGRE